MVQSIMCWYSKDKVIYRIVVFEVTLHIGDTNDATKFAFSVYFKECFKHLFPGKMVAFTLNSYCVLQIQRKKPFCA